MFLLSNIFDEIREASSYDGGNHGPHSKVVEEELEYLRQMSVLSMNGDNIEITPLGKEIAKEILKKEDKDTIYTISAQKKFLNDLSNKEILAYICAAYPDTAKESVVYDDIIPDIEKYVISLSLIHI